MPDLAREAGVFELSTRRGKQFNSLIYDEVDPITGANRDAIFMNRRMPPSCTWPIMTGSP